MNFPPQRYNFGAHKNQGLRPDRFGDGQFPNTGFDGAGRMREDLSPDAPPMDEPQTFIFSELPPEEKLKFMDFLISNDVEFQIDPEDNTYVATIKIVNKTGQDEEYGQDMGGMDQFNNNFGASKRSRTPLDEQQLLQNQIIDLTRVENRLKQHDEQQSLKEYSRNKRGDGLLTTGGTVESKASRVSSARPNKSPTPKKLASARASPDKKKPKPMHTTSAAQLQVYLKPEYKNFTEALNPRNPQQIRPKRMNISQTLRNIEEIYSHRFTQKEGKTLHESIVELLKTKFKQKAMVDQNGFDLLASVEQHRETCPEVNLFYKFITQEYQLKELLYFLYVRSLAERELSIPIVKLPSSQDIRSLKISSKKCYKIAKIYFENVLAISNEVQQETQKLNSNAPDVAAENFVELCIADAGIEEKYYPNENKIQLPFFLMKLLNEFRHHEISNAIEGQRSIHASPHGSLTPINQIDEEFQDSLPNQNIGDGSPQQKEAMLLNKIIRYIVGNKVNQMISFMLSQYQEGLSKEVLDMIREEIKGVLEGKIQMLLQSAFMDDTNQWFQLLQIDHPDEEQKELLEQVMAQIDTIFNAASFNESLNDSVVIEEGHLEELARVLLSCKELRSEFANQVSSLTLEAKRGLESDQSIQFDDGQQHQY